MRQKAYYSPGEIVTDLYTSGSEWMYTSGVEYIGLYHQYVTGETYTQPTWNPATSVELVTYQDITTSAYQYKQLNPINVAFNSIQPYVPNPSNNDIQQGSFTRYFIKRINASQILEIDNDTYQQWLTREIDPYIHVATDITWYIAGDVNAVAQENANQIKQAQSAIPTIHTKLPDTLQFYTDNIYTVSIDINNLDS
jgi:hypothetical protein